MTNNVLVQSIRSSLHSAADATRGLGAQAYMKSEMPSLGVRVPEVRRIVKAAAKQFPVTSPDDLRNAVLELWRHAEAREERYAAIDLTGLRMVKDDLQHVVRLRGDYSDRSLVGPRGRSRAPDLWAPSRPPIHHDTDPSSMGQG